MGTGRLCRWPCLGGAQLPGEGREAATAPARSICSTAHPPPGTPSRQRTRPGVCLSYVVLIFLFSELKQRHGWEGFPALAGGTSLPASLQPPQWQQRFPAPLATGNGASAPSRVPQARASTPRSPFRGSRRGLSGLGLWDADDDTSGLPPEAVPGPLGRGVPRKCCKKLLGNRYRVKSWHGQEQLPDTSYIIFVPLTATS